MTTLMIVVAVIAVAAAAGAAAADAAAFAESVEPPSSRPLTGSATVITGARERLHRVLALARIASYLVTGAAVWSAVEGAGMQGGVVVWAAGALVMVFVIEAGSRAYGERRGEAALDRLMPLVQALDIVLGPLRVPLDWMESTLERWFPVRPPDAAERERIATRFRRMVAAEAEVSRNEVAILYGVFSLRETVVHEIMVPRVDILSVQRSSPWSEVVDRVRASEHSRLPVYGETMDDISGILYAKDLLPHVLSDDEPRDGWESLIRPASFIPRTRLIGAQLRDFRASGSHMAIVVDEFGGTAGLVTIEDVLEEIVGEIRDEYDEEEPEIEVRDGRRFWLSGRITLEEASDLLGVELEREGISTVGGLVYEELGRVPKAGEELNVGGFRVIVERVRGRMVKRVYFERVAEPAPDDQATE